MIVSVKKLNENAVLPYKTYNEDFCYDVVATSEEQVAPNVWKYGIGLAMEIVRSNSEPMGHRVVEIREGFNEEEEVWETLAKTKYYQYDFCNSPIKMSIDFRPRSSVWKTGMVLSNCEGTIDESYRGEISAVFYHVMPDMPRYKVGDKIGQIKLGFTMPMDFNIVKKLSDSKRGTNGYGSTGK